MDLLKNIENVKARIRRSAETSGRDPNEIELLAVSKQKPVEMILEAYHCGLRTFGENYIEELLEKAEKTHEHGIKWVFIGQLQSNKIKRLMTRVSEIHTVASEKHLRYISDYLESNDLSDFPVYLHVNAEAESQKFGMSKQDALSLSLKVPQLFPRIKLQGVFAIPAEETSSLAASGTIPSVFSELRELADKVGQRKLSLGMSLDLEVAIKAGSTCVRIGSDIFGKRFN